jgi:hypothetical protein
MRFSAAAVTAIALLAPVAACSCGGDGSSVDAALPDAAPPDGAGPLGTWRLIEQRGGAAPLTHEGPDRVNGTLELNAVDIGVATIVVADDRLVVPVEPALVDTYTISTDGARFELGSGTMLAFSLSDSPERLVLETDSTYERMTHQEQDTLPVTGVVSVEPGADPFAPIVTPRVGLVFLVRGGGAQPAIIEVPGGDVALTGFGADPGQTTQFDLSRVEGALGVERIVFGTAFASLGLVVVYDDVNGNGLLDDLWNSCDAGEDCVRGVSPLFVAYRLGTSPEIMASPFTFLRERWTPGIASRDLRTGTERLGVVSLDRAAADAPPYDVVVTRGEGTAVIPPFTL